MGKVTKLIEEIRNAKGKDLIGRYRHILVAWGVREYLDAKPDVNLNVEINLIEEELERRIANKLNIL